MNKLSLETSQCFMTPLHLAILVHYHSVCEDVEHLTAPAVREYIKELITHGMLESTEGKESLGRSYRTTDKGDAWIFAVLKVPFPVPRWEVKWPQP